MREAAAAKFNVIPLSDNTVQRHISEMISVKEQVLDGIRESPYFSIQIEESTDVANCVQLVTYVHYIRKLSFREEFLFCHFLKAHTTA